MSDNTVKGKTSIITGTTAGIGRVTAIELAKMGAKVVMICRNRTKGEALRAEIRRSVPTAHVELVVADLSLMAEVKRAADDFKRSHSELHLLINNAGAIHANRMVTEEGLEVTFAANYLSNVLLTRELLDILLCSVPARIINVSSDGHTRGALNFDDLQGATRFSFLAAYNQSKLAQILYTYDLAERLSGTKVTVNALHPGLVSSNFNKGTKGIAHLLGSVIYSLRGISVEMGAQTTLYLAASPEVDGVTGKYFSDCRQTPSSNQSYDVSLRKRLREVTEELLSRIEGTGRTSAPTASE